MMTASVAIPVASVPGAVLLQSKRFMGNYIQRLLELGMPEAEAKKVARAVMKYKVAKQAKQQRRSLKVRELQPIYWRRLIEANVPLHEAGTIAEIIANFDVLKRSPSLAQRQLLQQYCRYICRAELWRSRLFVDGVDL